MSEYPVYIIDGVKVRYMVDEWDKKPAQETPKKVATQAPRAPKQAKEQERE